MSVDISELAEQITETLTEYTQEVSKKVKKAVDKTARQVNEEIKQHITFKDRTGEYRKAFRLKTVKENESGKIKVWHVKKPHYRLTHLLEKGHINKNGTRTRAFPHIKYGEEIAKKNLEQIVREEIERINGT